MLLIYGQPYFFMADWIKIAESVAEISFNPNGLALVQAGERMICMGRFKETIFAFAPKCPHASGPMVNGWIDALGNVVCPLHRYKFCLQNGRNVSGEGYHLRHWPVEVREDGVWVKLKEQSLFSFLGSK